MKNQQESQNKKQNLGGYPVNNSAQIDKLVAEFNRQGLNKRKMIKLLDMMDLAIQNNSYTGKLRDIKKEFDELYKFYFYEWEEFE